MYVNLFVREYFVYHFIWNRIVCMSFYLEENNMYVILFLRE